MQACVTEWIAVDEPSDSSSPGQTKGGPACREHVEFGLAALAECFDPLLHEVVGYAIGSPQAYVRLCELQSRSLREQLRPRRTATWRRLYAMRWPAFYEAALSGPAPDWLALYRATRAGKVELILEVFEREKKVGFAMSAMAAKVQYEAIADVYIARYLSASEVPPEAIPSTEEHRLRFCPSSARAQLLPRSAEDTVAEPQVLLGQALYPYRVLSGVDGLEVGKGVELQWKMQSGSPFGWWFGHLEALRKLEDGVVEATITFRHFPPSSRWYRLVVCFGDGEMRPCVFGGFTGGARAVSGPEQRRWMRYFPMRPVMVSQDAL